MDRIRESEKTLKALANRRRLAIILYIQKHREASVGEIAGAIKLSLRSTSRHLSVLAASSILEREQRGLSMYYRVAQNQHPILGVVLRLL